MVGFPVSLWRLYGYDWIWLDGYHRHARQGHGQTHGRCSPTKASRAAHEARPSANAKVRRMMHSQEAMMLLMIRDAVTVPNRVEVGNGE